MTGKCLQHSPDIIHNIDYLLANEQVDVAINNN